MPPTLIMLDLLFLVFIAIDIIFTYVYTDNVVITIIIFLTNLLLLLFIMKLEYLYCNNLDLIENGKIILTNSIYYDILK